MEAELEREAEPVEEQRESSAAPAAQDTADQAPEQRPRPAGGAEQRPRPAGGGEDRPRRHGRFRRRVCQMCAEKMPYVDYKDFSFLRRYVSDRGRIEGRRKGGTCSKHQRALAQAIKRARHLALLPYCPDHVRSGAGQYR